MPAGLDVDKIGPVDVAVSGQVIDLSGPPLAEGALGRDPGRVGS